MGLIFLFFAAICPRVTLAFCWLFGAIPANDTPLLVDLMGAIFMPRLLVAWWLWEGGHHPLLVAIFVLLELVELGRVTLPRGKHRPRPEFEPY